MKRLIILILVMAIMPVRNLFSQQKFGNNTFCKQVSGERVYTIGILEMSDSERQEFNSRFNEHSQMQEKNRGLFIQSLIAANRSALVSKVSSTTESIIGIAISRLSDDMKSSRSKWEQAVQKECRFSKSLGMVEEINDFYSNISTRGALDAANTMFDGFVCRQDIKVGQDTVNVFYVSCKLDTSKIRRMVSHSKFELYVDSVRFNPFNCDIPNDSLQDISKRIAFSFDNREDLRLKIHADVTSSWINEAVMVFRNEKLGEFDIEIKIDPKVVNENPEKVYTYKAGNAKYNDQVKDISIVGESFVVPRSYAGNNVEGTNSIWGTGQYKINMNISETCRIKQDYYTENAGYNPDPEGKRRKIEWNDNWESEWKLINSRKKEDSFWKETWTVIKTNWAGNQWLTEITSPTTTYLIQEGSSFLNAIGPGSTGAASPQTTTPSGDMSATMP